ncbi:hypothetical protein [Agreia pratensis]|uniref:Uncharacterized protein n=1 Tax=Agreia pratensis TaxID=150121 RepID=A0A1X7JW87_9MICO|nr:hypothetical protein [Agreia pratensis]SMG32099.1 hypothetical protein SAMN06296010_1885 [Agreia pratensis]
MSDERTAAAPRAKSRWAVFGFWLWAAAIALVVAATILGIALNDTLPTDMGIRASVTFPVVASLIAIPLSTVGLAFAITALAKREPRKGLAITTIVLWAVTPIVALAVARGLATLVS